MFNFVAYIKVIFMNERKANTNKKLNILVVEDNHVNLMYFVLIVKDICPESNIFQAVNGKIAIDCLKNNEIDFVFLDLYMPVLDGFAVARYIRETPNIKTIPIIAISALNRDEDINYAYESGVNDFLQKPATKDDVKHKFEKYLKGLEYISEKSNSEVSKAKRHFCEGDLFEKIGQDKAFFSQLLKSYFDTYSNDIQIVLDACQRSDYELIISKLHHLKGGASSLCFEIKTELLNKLEFAAITNSSEFNSIFQEVEVENIYLKNYFKEYLND